jgi:chitinase
MAVSLEELGSAKDYLHLYKLVKRAPQGATVYNLTFDYNFHVLQGRADAEDVLIRIDYSNDKGYWHDMVAAAPGDPLKKRDDYDEVAAIVKRDHGGDWKRYRMSTITPHTASHLNTS